MGQKFGMNSRINEIQCVILLNKLDYINKNLSKRKKMLDIYNNEIGNFSINWSSESSPHIYPIITKNRNKFINKMSSIGIETVIHYPFHLSNIMNNTKKYKKSEAYKLSKTVVSIPFNPWLSDNEIEYILDNVKRFLK